MVVLCRHILLAEEMGRRSRRSALINKIKLRFGTQGSPRRNKVRSSPDLSIYGDVEGPGGVLQGDGGAGGAST